MTQDKIGAEFEAWATEQGLARYRCQFRTDEYESAYTQTAWEAWQAAQKREPLSEVEILKAVRHLYQHQEAADLGSKDDIITARAIEAAHNITKE